MKSVKRFLHHLFIPQETNNYRAKALHLDFLTYYLIFVLFLTFGFKILSSKSADVLGFATDITIEKNGIIHINHCGLKLENPKTIKLIATNNLLKPR